MGVERDNRHAPESISSDDSVPRPQDALSEGDGVATSSFAGGRSQVGNAGSPSPSENARCAHCKTMSRAGLLCKNCGRLVPFPPRSSQNATGIPYRPTSGA